MEFCRLLALAGLILVETVGGHAKGAHALAGGRGTELRIAGDVAEHKGLIEVHANFVYER